MDFSNLFFSEFEEKKGCIYRVVPAHSGRDLQSFWNNPLTLVLEANIIYGTKGIGKIKFNAELCYQYPMLTLHIPVLLVGNSKCVAEEIRNEIATKRANVPIIEKQNAIFCLPKRDFDLLTFYPTIRNLSIAAEDIRSANAIISMRCSSANVKFSSSL